MKKHISYDKISLCEIQKLRSLTGIPIEVVRDKDALAISFATAVIDCVRYANAHKKRAVIIMPVGPTGQWKLMVDIAIRENINLSNLSIIQMDEYLDAQSRPILMTHPFSFTGFVWRAFAQKATQECGFKKENWIVPDSMDTGAIDRAIERWGGVDVAFAGIGLNGHIAFNESPLSSEAWTDESFANSSTRIIRLTDVTKATNSIFGAGGNLEQVPDYAISIGMKQILNAKRIHVFLDWHWQCFPMRRALLGPMSRFFPASLIQMHKDIKFTITEEVARVHQLLPE